MPWNLSQPPVSSQFGVNEGSNGKISSCWICRSTVEGESHNERSCEMEERLKADMRSCTTIDFTLQRKRSGCANYLTTLTDKVPFKVLEITSFPYLNFLKICNMC